MEFNHWLRGFCFVPPTAKEGVELDRHRMAWALRTVNSFEELGFQVDRRSIRIDPSGIGHGMTLGFRFRPRGDILKVYGI